MVGTSYTPMPSTALRITGNAPTQRISPRNNPRAEALTPAVPISIIVFRIVEPRAMRMPISRVLGVTMFRYQGEDANRTQ
jgi:hypothetical protein